MCSIIKKSFTFNFVFISYLAAILLDLEFAEEEFFVIGILIFALADFFIKQISFRKQKEKDLILDNLPIVAFLRNKKGKLVKSTNGINMRSLKEYFNKYSVIIKTEDEQILSEKKPLSAHRKIETDYQGEQWHKVIKLPVLDKKENVENIITYCRNVQNDINEEEKKNTFIATMVHDLKNPIIAQIKILEVLIKQDKKEENKEREEIHAQMLTSARNLFEIVMATLNTYKFEKGEINYEFQKCNIAEIIEEVCAEKTHLTSNSNEIIIDIHSKAKLVKADKMHLRRVISNILSNAIHYRKEGTKIHIELSSDDENIFFSVTNQGYYIKPELQADIFKKYVSNSSKFNSIGTGLGLYISKKIILAHGGDMMMRSTKEGLNTFGFFIPKLSQSAKLQLAQAPKEEVKKENEIVYL